MQQYLAVFPDEQPRLRSFEELLNLELDLRSRMTAPGHVTASGMLCDPTERQVLLIHHGTLGKWLQPGGHVEGDELPPVAARREVREEVGITVHRLLSLAPDQLLPIDIDSHDIPANSRKAEPAHTHHDFLFAFEVSRADSEVALQIEEVSDSQWMNYSDARLEPRLQRVVRKLQSQQLWPMSV